jgi:rhamnosyltransferase subunit B
MDELDGRRDGRKKRIVLTAFGSHGDINPFIALALGLKAEGFEPVLASSETYRQKINSEGLAFCAVRPTLEQLLHDTGLSPAELARKLMTKHLEFMIETTVTPYLDQAFADLKEIMAGADLVVASSLDLAGRLVAEKFDIPLVSVLLSPMLFYSADDPPSFIDVQWLPRVRAIFGRAATKVCIDIIRAQVRRMLHRVNELRATIGLPATDRVELLDGLMRGVIIAGLYSPLLAKLPADVPSQSFIAGFTFYDKRGGGEIALPAGLEKFLNTGSPPIVFTLGTMVAHDPAHFYDSSVDAARALGRRSVLLVAPELERAIAGKHAADDVYVAGYVPYSLVFPRAAVIVHHGGIGTIAQAMRAGKTQLVCPLLGDQVDNAERLRRIGIGKRIDLAKYTAKRAAEALRALVVEDGKPALIAARLAPMIAVEDGVAALVAKIVALPQMKSG